MYLKGFYKGIIILMRALIDWIFFILVLSVAGRFVYTNREQLCVTARYLRNAMLPCSYPMLYSIGSIDPRFGVSTETFINYLKDAEAVWEEPSGKNLFEYTPSNGDVTVSLIYDSRQAATDKLKAMGIKTDQTRDTYDALKARYDMLLRQVEAAQAEHKIKLTAYKRGEAAYNAKVKRLNQRGRVTAAEERRLKARRRALEREFGVLRRVEEAGNGNIDVLNALATALNQLIVQLNINVEQYRRAGATLGQFEEGLYKMSGGLRTIDVYQYSDRLQLICLLAHEMGHALGLEHTPDPQTIMYKINMGASLKATSTDLAQLNRVCTAGISGIKP